MICYSLAVLSQKLKANDGYVDWPEQHKYQRFWSRFLELQLNCDQFRSGLRPSKRVKAILRTIYLGQ